MSDDKIDRKARELQAVVDSATLPNDLRTTLETLTNFGLASHISVYEIDQQLKVQAAQLKKQVDKIKSLGLKLSADILKAIELVKVCIRQVEVHLNHAQSVSNTLDTWASEDPNTAIDLFLELGKVRDEAEKGLSREKELDKSHARKVYKSVDQITKDFAVLQNEIQLLLDQRSKEYHGLSSDEIKKRVSELQVQLLAATEPLITRYRMNSGVIEAVVDSVLEGEASNKTLLDRFKALIKRHRRKKVKSA